MMRKSIKFFATFVLPSLFTAYLALAQISSYYETQGWDESFYGGPYEADVPHDSTFYTTSLVFVGGEPGYGYPMCSGQQVGLSDTALLIVSLVNATYSPISLSGSQPSTWITPVLFEKDIDPHYFSPIADSSMLKWRLLQWVNSSNQVVSQPTSIPPHSGYKMVFDVWGFDTGSYRLLVKKTPSAPTNLNVLIGYGGDVWATQPQQMTDTINAWIGCYWRSIDTQSPQTSSAKWIDSVLTKNPKSLAGYSLKTHFYSQYFDSLSLLNAIDSVLAIANRYGDPVISDTAKFNTWDWAWYKQIVSVANHTRNKLISGYWHQVEL